jgi:hypothetical protein
LTTAAATSSIGGTLPPPSIVTNRMSAILTAPWSMAAAHAAGTV